LQPDRSPRGGNAVSITRNLNVRSTFDILKRDRKGTFLWLEAVRDIEAAEARLRQLSAESSEEFIVFRNADLQVVASSRKD
jgi:hypothetical protein